MILTTACATIYQQSSAYEFPMAGIVETLVPGPVPQKLLIFCLKPYTLDTHHSPQKKNRTSNFLFSSRNDTISR